MICKKCREQLDDNAKFCTKCGTACDGEIPVSDGEKPQTSASGTKQTAERAGSSKKKTVIITVAAVLLIGCGIAAVVAMNSRGEKSSVSRDISLAESDLSEQNYGNAETGFKKALEKDPTNVDAYLGLAETYIARGQTDNAIGTLKEGLEKTGDDRIKNKLEELTAKPAASSKPSSGSLSNTSSVSTGTMGTSSSSNISSGSSAASSSAVPGSTTAGSSAASSSDVSKPTPLPPVGNVTILGAEYSVADTTELDLSYRQLTDEQLKTIAPQIKNLINLKKLDMSYNEIADASPLAGLAGVTELNLGYNRLNVGTLPQLASLPDLRELNLEGNNISDLTFASKLTQLTSLNLGDNPISDLTPLAKLTGLNELGIDFGKVSSLSPLSTLTGLRRLSMAHNVVADLKPLEGLTGLTDINLNFNSVSDISPLAKLTKLKELAICDNGIVSLSPLSKLTGLEYLMLDDNKISDVAPLYGLSNLSLVMLRGNSVSGGDIEMLKSKLPNCNVSA